MNTVWHVLLLPAGADWRWMEASRLYVERFRVIPIMNPEIALALPGDPLIVSLVLPDGRPGHTAAWLRQRRPSIRLDPLFASTPERLQRILDARTAHGTRLGRGLWVVTTDRLNVRSGPGFSAPIIGRLEAGTEVEVVGQSADGAWWAIVDPMRRERAWIAAAYTRVIAGIPETVPVLLAQPPQVRAQAPRVVRRDPDPGAPILGQLPAGADREALAQTADGQWVQIAFPDAAHPGWVPKEGLEILRGTLEGLPVHPSGRWLHPPVKSPVIHRAFGVDPVSFAAWGLPGHEGVDFHASPGEPVYAAAEGRVVMAAERPDHPYGTQVRIQHQRTDGVYVTVYGHLMPGALEVQAGEWVQTGQPLGRAGSRGFIHLTVKKEGARNGAYGDILDPMVFLVL
ncbi:peptidoglycan DD-metalloendopeptidase family protein [Thermoflexus sp.]|uniref:peptidoglycan DD-metalloendopeptidase family protein n=1 Tax=Thermoflexus sp. TaxID=1969742 RepID=UPI0025CF09C4|nr:peptidoglycan DD-metalloendopeptidase family protein [Thermoflexus sp.]MDW8179339.1 peptidoglycan DD-metalloendopeptidase family protein [Anaerolineae bacterium]MCS6964980.1 peptidoglycan DD-metalloendopeptidase family protein [Thermoflexus sp.]MCS7349893.1 peptidoglycan DD-metalloendopeptidase family protein [Thermoflexus sp.]MCX7690767.1 peptidoglycan DD-metalloendopeptidase family protein [Thermoflexus sp.]MDW8184610.1 peptidoglycan DD-metalloendopeptidase family protein [Anaerolineae ba